MSFNRNIQLLPGTRYVARVRAINGLGVTSGWSESIMFESVGDTLSPNLVTNLLCDFTSPDIILSWTPPTTNINGTPLLDLARYKVSIRFGFVTKSYFTTQANYTYTFLQNQVDFTSAQPILNVTVQAVDTSNNLSPAVNVTATNLPPPLTAPVLAPGLTSGLNIVVVNIAVPADVTDYRSFQLYRSTDNFGSTSVFIGTVEGTTFADSVTIATAYWYRFKLIDVFNQVALSYSPIGNIVTGSVGGSDLVPPNKPTGISASPGIDAVTQIPYVDVSWVNPTHDSDGSILTDMARSEIKLNQTIPNIDTFATETATRTGHRFTGLVPSSAYTVTVQAYDVVGNASGFQTATSFVTGLGAITNDLIQMKTYTANGTALVFSNATYATFYSALTFTKRVAGTSLIVQLSGSGYATTLGLLQLAIQVNGSGFTSCGQFYFSGTGVHQTFTGLVEIAGIAAGIGTTVQAALQLVGGAVLATDTTDTLSFTVTETYP